MPNISKSNRGKTISKDDNFKSSIKAIRNNDLPVKEKQEAYRKAYYNEAIRYMENAKDLLKKANPEGDFYRDSKYVKTACGIAYNGVLLALDGYAIITEYSSESKKEKEKKSIEFYRVMVTRINYSLLDYLNSAYNLLHLAGCYDGEKSIVTIETGFELANKIINVIKPTK